MDFGSQDGSLSYRVEAIPIAIPSYTTGNIYGAGGGGGQP
jgi:hypothetical protein